MCVCLAVHLDLIFRCVCLYNVQINICDLCSIELYVVTMFHSNHKYMCIYILLLFCYKGICFPFGVNCPHISIIIIIIMVLACVLLSVNINQWPRWYSQCDWNNGRRGFSVFLVVLRYTVIYICICEGVYANATLS